MPRGYLKHNKDVSYKVRRGGASGKGYNYAKEYEPKLDDWRDRLASRVDAGLNEFYTEDDYDNENTFDESSPPDQSDKQPTTIVGTCSICLESCSLTKLLKKCNHPHACNTCLRQVYIVQAQKSVSNYPLKCFYPDCGRPVRDTQVQGLIQSEAELTRHYRLTTLAKAYKQESQSVIHCPFCDHPKTSFISSKSHHLVRCKNCKERYIVASNETNEFSTMTAVDNFKHDSIGRNDGWAKCPKCRMIISKGDGCDHMMCPCGHHFSWEEAKAYSNAKRPKVTTFVMATRLP